MNRVIAPGASPFNLLQVLLQSRSIMASKCISKLPRSWHPSLHDHGIEMHHKTRSITASKSARSWSGNASPIILDYGLQVHLWVHSISASKCISKLTRLWPASESLSSLYLCLPVHLQTSLNTSSKSISEFAWSSSTGAPQIALKHRLQPVKIYCVYIW